MSAALVFNIFSFILDIWPTYWKELMLCTSQLFLNRSDTSFIFFLLSFFSPSGHRADPFLCVFWTVCDWTPTNCVESWPLKESNVEITSFLASWIFSAKVLVLLLWLLSGLLIYTNFERWWKSLTVCVNLSPIICVTSVCLGFFKLSKTR